MGIFDKVKQLLGSAQSKLPEDLNSVDELKARAQQLANDHGDQVNKVVDAAQEKLAKDNEGLNQRIDGIQQKVDDFAKKEQ